MYNLMFNRLVRFSLSVLFVFSFLSTLHAAVPNPHGEVLLLEKIVRTGYVLEEHAFQMECRVTAKKVFVNFRKQGLKKSIELDKNVNPKAENLIIAAAKGNITSRVAPADIGDLIYLAHMPNPNDSFTQIDLGSTLDSRTITENDSPEAFELRTLLDSVCDEALRAF